MNSFEKDLEGILQTEVDVENADPKLVKKLIQTKSEEKYGSLKEFITEYARKKGIFPSTLKKILKSYKKQKHYTADSAKKIEFIRELLQELGFNTKEPEYKKIWKHGIFGYLNTQISKTEIGSKEKTKELIEEIKYAIKVKANEKYPSIDDFFKDVSSKINMTQDSLQTNFAITKDTRLSTLIMYQQILNYLNSKNDIKPF